MKKFLVIGNPIQHSLSPELHTFWMKKNNIKGTYQKRELAENELEKLTNQVRKKNFFGVNVTVPFKKKIITHLDKLTEAAKATESVNTIYLKDEKLYGHNTDIEGFTQAIKKINFSIKNKKAFIIGAGGVVSSIIYALHQMQISKIFICNRTKTKVENLKDMFGDLEIINWGSIPDFDIVINATSLGLNSNDNIPFDLSNIGPDKFFYDVIYNPSETNFLKSGKKTGNRVENGKMMFIYQASAAFKIWHDINPEIDNEVIKIIDR